jgi:hypothetical protein
MTVRAITGLVVYNVFLLAVGAGVLWGVRGWRWWTDLVRLAGVAYLLGISSLMILLTVELVVGIPITFATTVLSGSALVALGLLAGRYLGRSVPGLRPPGWQFPGLSLFAALFVAGIVVYFEALFRADRLSGIAREWDAWAFWMPKAQSLYFFGRLEPEFLQMLPQRPSYPPGLATIQAGAFHAMGAADTASLHVQYWFFAVGFGCAVVGLLARRVHHAILFPLLLAFLVAPSLVEKVTTVYADVPLGYLVALAALLVVLWMGERRTWQLAAATILLAGAMLTKREGILFAACILVAALVASWADRRRLWRPLIVAGAVAFGLALPWRIWFMAHGLEGDGPDSGYLGAFGYLERVWPSLRLAVSALFDTDLWRFAPSVALVAIVVAAFAGAWRVAVYSGVLLGCAIAGATWTSWAYTALPITQNESQNPIVRITGITVLVLAVLTPVLLQHAWSGGARREAAPASGTAAPPRAEALLWRTRWTWSIVVLAALSHPGAMLVGYSGSGLPGGAPRWPGVADCVTAPAPGRSVRVVVGYAESYPEANALRERAVSAGLAGTQVARDGCGRLRVFVDDVASVAASQALVADARAARLDATVELDPDS